MRCCAACPAAKSRPKTTFWRMTPGSWSLTFPIRTASSAGACPCWRSSTTGLPGLPPTPWPTPCASGPTSTPSPLTCPSWDFMRPCPCPPQSTFSNSTPCAQRHPVVDSRLVFAMVRAFSAARFPPKIEGRISRPSSSHHQPRGAHRLENMEESWQLCTRSTSSWCAARSTPSSRPSCLRATW